MEDRIAELESEVETLKIELNEVSAKCKSEVEKLRSELGDIQVPRDKTEESIINKKGFASVSAYGGEAEKFGLWYFKLELFLLASHPELDQVMKWSVAIGEPVTVEDMDKYCRTTNIPREYLNTLSNQLYILLGSKTTGTAEVMVRGLREAGHARGILAWQKIHTEARGLNGVGLQALNRRVNSPSRATKMTDVEPMITQWELDLKRLQDLTGTAMMEVQAKEALLAIVPKDLKTRCTP